MKNNKLLIILLSVLLVSLSGCNSEIKPKKDHNKKPIGAGYHFTTTNGLDCYYFSGGYDGGLSCNWEKLNKEQKAN